MDADFGHCQQETSQSKPALGVSPNSTWAVFAMVPKGYRNKPLKMSPDLRKLARIVSKKFPNLLMIHPRAPYLLCISQPIYMQLTTTINPLLFISHCPISAQSALSLAVTAQVH